MRTACARHMRPMQAHAAACAREHSVCTLHACRTCMQPHMRCISYGACTTTSIGGGSAVPSHSISGARCEAGCSTSAPPPPRGKSTRGICMCVLHVHTACAYWVVVALSLYSPTQQQGEPHAHDAHARCTYTMHMHDAHARCTCTMHTHYAHTRCTYTMHVHDAHTLCTRTMHILDAHT